MNSPIGILIVAFIGAAVTYAVGYRNGAAQAEARAEHEVMQAVLWADHPLDVAKFYAGYCPDPPEDVNHDDDLVDEVEAELEAPPTAVEVAVEVDDGPAEGFRVGGRPDIRPAVPAAQLLPDPADRVTATSHRKMRRPLVGWLDDTATAIVNRFRLRGKGVVVAIYHPKCARCGDAGRIDDPAISYGWKPCPDCCCTEPGCGVHTGGGFCPTHQDADDLRADAAGVRAADL